MKQCLAVLIIIAALGGIPPAYAAAGAFIVTLMVIPTSATVGAQATFIVHTRPGADCTIRLTDSVGADIALSPSHQHVGETGSISWRWMVRTTASSAQAFASCQWDGQGRGDFATITIKGRRDLPPTARPKPSRPGIAVLGATKEAWKQIFGPYLKSTTDGYEGWQACFVPGITPRVSAAFREGHAFAISGAFCTDHPPSAAQRLNEAGQYMPADSVRIGTQKADGGRDIVYYSATLAEDGGFVPGDFLDCNIRLVRRGTFSLSLAVPSAIDWTLQLGTCA